MTAGPARTLTTDSGRQWLTWLLPGPAKARGQDLELCYKYSCLLRGDRADGAVQSWYGRGAECRRGQTCGVHPAGLVGGIGACHTWLGVRAGRGLVQAGGSPTPQRLPGPARGPGRWHGGAGAQLASFRAWRGTRVVRRTLRVMWGSSWHQGVPVPPPGWWPHTLRANSGSTKAARCTSAL